MIKIDAGILGVTVSGLDLNRPLSDVNQARAPDQDQLMKRALERVDEVLDSDDIEATLAPVRNA